MPRRLDEGTGPKGPVNGEASQRLTHEAPLLPTRHGPILAAVFGPSPADLYFFEEIENGVHPSRAHLLVDLIGQQARARGIKVIVSTHAPALLSAMPPADLAQAVYCYLDLGEGGQETKLITFHEIPHLEDRLAEVRVDALFADGWIETALSLATDPTHP